ncbi:MAG: glycosyltransferase family 39 protein [bacterium]
MNRIRSLFQYLGCKDTVVKIFILGLLLRVGMTVYLGERLLPLADQPVFMDMAENIATGQGLVVSQEMIGIPAAIPDSMRAELEKRPERIRDQELNALWGVVKAETPTAFFEPFYPYFLGTIRAVFGKTPGWSIMGLPGEYNYGPRVVVARLFQSIFDASVILILYYLGVALFTPATGGIAALIYCFYPYSLAFVTNMVTQNTYLFLQALMVFFFVRTLNRQNWRNYLLLGISAGLTLLTRISLITFLPFIIICFWLALRNRVDWGKLAVSLIIMAAVIVPWVIRNNNVMGEPLLLPTKGGRNLWEYNNQVFTQEKMTGKTIGVAKMYQDFAIKNYPDLKRKDLIEFPAFTDETEIERDNIMKQRVTDFIKANPVVYIKLCFFRIYQLFRVIPRHLGGPLATLAALGTWGWILPASLLGLLMSFKYWRRRAVIYAILFYTVGTHALTAAGIPHRVPTDPYFILLAAYFLVRITKADQEIFTEN